MTNEVMKVYEMPDDVKKMKYHNNDNYIDIKLNMDIAFEEMTKRFTEKTDEEIANYLYNKYKDTDVSSIYVLSKPEFKDFLETMLPKYMKRKRGKRR